MKRIVLLLMAAFFLKAADVNTFSVVAYDPVNQDWGVAVASRYFSVGAVVPWAEAGVGAIATQANVNVGYGPAGLDALRKGMAAKDVLAKLRADDQFPQPDTRQVAIIDRKGNIATYTGANATKWAGDRQGKTWSVQGNNLVGPQVLEAMGKAFEATPGELAEKLFAALKAGDDAGGDSRGKQSASILVVRERGGRNFNNDRYVFLNVDDNPAPIRELRRLLDINLGLLYSQRVGPLLLDRKFREARDAAAKGAHYMPAANSYFVLGDMDYGLGDKAAAAADFRKAMELDPAVRQRLQSPSSKIPSEIGSMGRTLRQILEDKKFLAQVLAK